LSSNPPSAGSDAGAATGLPAHVAIIMDGNGRWARQRLLSRIQGHEKGAEAVRTTVRTCRERGIPFLTLYAFSTENWQRPKTEVNALMGLLRRFLESELRELLKNGIRLHVIGRRDRLPENVQKALAAAVNDTRQNSTLQLTLALSYGGRDEITRAAQSLAVEVQAGRMRPADITEELQRIAFHAKSFRQKLAISGPIGKELDFICQEMQREANTTGAKSCDVQISSRVVQIKSEIEKLREQVQNVE